MFGWDDAVGVVAPEVAKGLWKSIPNAIDKARIRKFFGESVFEKFLFRFISDCYEHPVARKNLGPAQNRYVKNFAGKKPAIPLRGEDTVLGKSALRNFKYALHSISKFFPDDDSIELVVDEDAVHKWTGSSISFGSSDSNIRTYDIENLNQNKVYKFVRIPQGIPSIPAFEVDNQQFGPSANHDTGIIARIKNPYDEGNYLFVCAGLGEWGTSGSTYYLFKHWKSLHKRYPKGQDFCIVINVTPGSDQTTTEVFSYSYK